MKSIIQGEFETFFFSVFDSSNVNFESSVIEFILCKEYEFPIEFEKLSNLNLEYFKNHLKNSENLDSLSTILFRRCLTKVPEYGTTINPIAKELFKEKVKESDLGRFILQNNEVPTFYYLNRNESAFYFNNDEDFKNWIFNNEKFDNQSDYFKEFIDFFNKSQGNTIRFDFKFLTPIKSNSFL